MVRSPRRLFGMDVLGGQRLTQDLLQVNNLFVCLFVNYLQKSFTNKIYNIIPYVYFLSVFDTLNISVME